MSPAAPASDRRALRRWLVELGRGRQLAIGSAPPRLVVAAVARAVAAHHRLTPPDRCPDEAELPVPPPAGWCTPRLPGLVYEALTDPADRRSRGAWFTPPHVVDGLVAMAVADAPIPATVLDPACGGGAFLLGIADALHRRGLPAGDVVDRLTGIDLDPGAVEVCRWSLDLWSSLNGVPPGRGSLVVGDGLAEALDPVELVVGNPPFGSPLRAERAASPGARYRRDHPLLGPYADEAACFLHRGARLTALGGRLVLVLPQSLLASRDAADLVADLGRSWALRRLWVAASPVFDAAVHVFAPVLERGPAAGAVPPARPATVHRDDAFTRVGHASCGTTWADAAADGLGVPALPPWDSDATLADLAGATSGFRAQHYGLAAACREQADAPGGAPVVTVGQIDPLRWLRDRPVRLGGRSWSRPVVDVEALDRSLGEWVRRQQRPKVLLATQSRVLEPLIDRTGALVPSTPVIAVHAEPDDLDWVAAVLLAPPVVAWAARRSIGTALQPQAIKLAARQVLEVPLPARVDLWEEAAALLAPVEATKPASPELLGAVALAMCRAYQVEPEPWCRWWWQRLPRRRTPPAPSDAAGRVGP